LVFGDVLVGDVARCLVVDELGGGMRSVRDEGRRERDERRGRRADVDRAVVYQPASAESLQVN
jgi:hypothetical protein